MRTILLILIPSIAILFQSCYSYNNLAIEILNPSQVTIPPEIQNFTLAYNTLPINENDISYTFGKLEFLTLQSEIPKSFIVGLKNKMEQSPRFSYTNLPIIKLPNIENPNNLPLKDSFIHDICVKYHTQGLVALESYHLQDTIINYYIDYEIYQVNRLISKSLWRMYDAVNRNLIDETYIYDTITWASNAESYSYNDAILQTANQAGEKYALRIAPYWTSNQRFYYAMVSGSLDFRKANKSFIKNDYKKVIDILSTTAISNDTRYNAKAAFNIAVAYEASDNLQKALYWIEKSDSLEPINESKEYIKILKKRIVMKDKLSLQLNK